MNERRRSPRLPPSVAIHVTDTMTAAVIGRVGNLSVDGLMLICDRPVADGAVFQFAFSLPDARGNSHPIELGAQQQWSTASVAGGQHWVGFGLVDIGASERQVLDDWLAGSQARLD